MTYGQENKEWPTKITFRGKRGDIMKHIFTRFSNYRHKNLMKYYSMKSSLLPKMVNFNLGHYFFMTMASKKIRLSKETCAFWLLTRKILNCVLYIFV